MKYSFILLFLYLSNYIYPQTELRGSMGIDFVSSPSLHDYLNQTYAPPDNQLGTFTSAINFSFEGDLFLSENYQVGLEISYFINSFTFNYDFDIYDISINIISPVLLNYYVIRGEGYEFKFGGGIGIPFIIADEKAFGFRTSTKYKTTGLGLVLRAEGNTILSGNVFVNLGVDLKYQLNGKPKNSDNYLINKATNEKVNFNSFVAGIHLGIMYRL